MTTDYETAQRYWSTQGGDASDLAGVAALGGCGPAEIVYRQHEETRTFTRLVPLAPTTSVLELGCGTGRWIAALAPRVGRYEAVDFSPAMLATAQRRSEALGLRNVDFVAANVAEYAPAQRFDVIYFSGVSQYLHDAELATLLQRLRPQLAPGGVIVDRSTLHRRQRGVSEQAGYFSIYRTGDEVARLFAAAGFALQRREPSYTPPNFPWLFQRVLRSRPAHRVVAATEPLAFAPLRWASRLTQAWLPPRGDGRDFTHEFFVFSREPSP